MQSSRDLRDPIVGLNTPHLRGHFRSHTRSRSFFSFSLAPLASHSNHENTFGTVTVFFPRRLESTTVSQGVADRPRRRTRYDETHCFSFRLS
jgi:hypothetical protein